jgi:hypothetical protein
MAAYTLQSFPHAGATVTYTQPATGTGNTAPCGQDIALLVKNGSGSSITVTIAVPAVITYDGLVIPSRTQTVGAGADGIIPLVSADYLDPATGLCAWGVSANTTVTAACITTTS